MEKITLPQRASSESTTVAGDVPASDDRRVILSVPQDQALEWLMNGGSITDAAQFAGVTRQTVSRWLRADPDFRAVYDAWRDQVATITEGQLLGLSETAVATIANAVRHRQDVRAAEFVLRHLAMIGKRK